MKTKQSELSTVHLLYVIHDLLVPQTANSLYSHSLEEMQGLLFVKNLKKVNLPLLEKFCRREIWE